MIKECKEIIESNFVLVDGDKKTTISGNTDTNKVAVHSEDNRKLTKEEIKSTLDDFKDELSTSELDDLTDEIPDDTSEM